MSRRPSIPSYRLHKATRQAIVTLGGTMFYLGDFGSSESREEYDRKIAEWLSRNRQPALPPVAADSAAITVTELVDRYWEFAKGYYVKDGKQTGEMHPLKTALRLLRKLYGSLPASEFSPLKLQAVREAMILEDWARSTINGQLKRVIRLFSWGSQQEMLPASVPVGLREVPGLEQGRSAARETDRILPVTDSAFQATLSFLPEVVVDLLRLARLTGMRPNEVCSIRPADIDRSGSVWVYVPRTHKTIHRGKTRAVAIGPKGQGILSKYLLRGADDFCFSPAESEQQRRDAARKRRKTPENYGNSTGTNVKSNPERTPGKQYNAGSLRHAIQRACDQAFPPPTELDTNQLKEWHDAHRWSPNQLRHSFATEVRAGFGLEAVRTLLGHSETATSEIYAERDLRQASEVAAMVG